MYTRIPKEKEENMLRVRGQESWASTMLIGSSHDSSKGTSLGSRKVLQHHAQKNRPCEPDDTPRNRTMSRVIIR